MPLDQARVSPLDRGFLFGDGVYEGLRAFGGHLVGMDLHVERLAQGLSECRIPFDASRMVPFTAELLRANGLSDAFIYWQVTRGVPAPGQPVRSRLLSGRVTPTVFGYAVPTPSLSACLVPAAKTAVLTEDTRWKRGHVKSISLLGSVLAAVEASEAGGEDAIMVWTDHTGRRLLSEATSANILLAIEGPSGIELVTPDLQSTPILGGVTRELLVRRGPAHGLTIVQRPVLESELAQTRELMILGTLSMVTSITSLTQSGRAGVMAAAGGRAGPIARRVIEVLVAIIAEEAAGAREAEHPAAR